MNGNSSSVAIERPSTTGKNNITPDLTKYTHKRSKMSHVIYKNLHMVNVPVPENMKGRKQRINKGKVVPAHAIKEYKGSGGRAPLILILSNRRRSVINFHNPAASLPVTTE
jgi:hypothetical protein